MGEEDREGGTGAGGWHRGREGGIGIEERYTNDQKWGTVWMSMYERGWATRRTRTCRRARRECEVNEGEDRVRKLVERRGMMRGLGCIGDAHVGGCRRGG